MKYRINQIKLDIDRNHDALKGAILKRLKKQSSEIEIYDIKIIRESIDARKKQDIKLVYTLEFSCDKELPLEEAKLREYKLPAFIKNRVEAASTDEAAEYRCDDHNGPRPVVAGFGPCGIFAALILAEAGLRPIVIERGEPVDDRVKTVDGFWQNGKLDPESNVQFGEGGAGTFSDGKLTTGIKDVRIAKVLEEFVEAGADGSILYKQKPHIGTDRLRDIVKNLRSKIESLGGEIRFNTRLTGLEITKKDNKIKLKGIDVFSNKTGGAKGTWDTIETDCLLLAIGHSARDTFKMLFDEGVPMEQKPFSIGVRIEHPQDMINRVQYGDASLAEKLGPADYKLNHRCENGRGVYTFCMCPGGQVINASSEAETAVTNGMSNSRRDSLYANSGLLVDVRTEDFESEHPLAGVEFQRKYEKLAYIQGNGQLPKTDYGHFRNNKDDAVRHSLPEFAVGSIIEAMPFLGRKLRGFDSEDAIMTAVETRSSSPVRLKRDENHQSNIKGIFPTGEGAGYAGGIMSAAVDGIKTAEEIIMNISIKL